MIYLDNAATSFPKAPGLGRAMADQIENFPGNPGRGSHPATLAADRLLFDARGAVSRAIGATDSGRLVFTKGATEAINIVLSGILGEGSVVVTSSLEHNAVMRPLRWLEKKRGIRLVVLPFDGAGRPEQDPLAQAAALRPDLAVFTMASNVTGAVLPWEDLTERFHRAGALVCLDGSQFLGHFPFSPTAVPVDFLCFPGHKGLLGPTGIGGLYLAGDRMPEALIRGGTGSHSLSEEQPEELPDRFEAGTQNLAGAAGLMHAVNFLSSVGFDAVARREKELTERLVAGFMAIPGLRVYGPMPGDGATQTPRAPVVSIGTETMPLYVFAAELDRRGIVARHGLQCAPEAHKSIGSLGCGGTVRFSPGFFTAQRELEETVRAVEEIVRGTSGRAGGQADERGDGRTDGDKRADDDKRTDDVNGG